MRVLFTRHLPFDTWPLGWWMRELGGALAQAGHEVHGLVAADQPVHAEPFPVGRVVCQSDDLSADLDFAPPGFAWHCGWAPTFDELSDDQISRYRDAWRRRLDREVDSFNPHVIHTGHLWLDAQLALETGVPYVVSAWSPELTACVDRTAWRGLVQQAAENASRIFVPHQALGAAVQATFGIAADHITVLPPAIEYRGQSAAATSSTQLRARFGLPDEGPIIAARATGTSDNGIDVLLNAAARCQAAAASQPSAAAPTTVVAVSANPDPEWTSQAQRLGLDRLRLIEIRDAADWPRLWQVADLAVLADRRPADGLDILWALSAGTPAIVTTASGLDWLAGCPAVRTIEAGDHELLAEAISEGLANSWKSVHGQSGVELVRGQHAMAAAASRFAEAYRTVLTERFGQLPRD